MARNGAPRPEPKSRHHDVDEESDDIFEVDAVAARHGRADRHVHIAGPPSEKRGEHREHHDERRRLLVAGHPLNRVRCRVRQREDHAPAPAGRRERSDEVGRPRQHRRQIGQCPAPEFGRARFHRLDGVRLPDDEIGVLQRRRTEIRWKSGRRGGVGARELAREDVERPAVADQMVQRQAQDRALHAGANQSNANQRTAGEIERARTLGGDRRPEIGLACALAQIDDITPHPALRPHDLHETGVAAPERRPKRLVPLDDGVDGRGERVGVNTTGNGQRVRHVIRRTGGIGVCGEPQPLLRGRGWKEIAVLRVWCDLRRQRNRDRRHGAASTRTEAR